MIALNRAYILSLLIKIQFVFACFLTSTIICFGQKTTGEFYMYKADGSLTPNKDEAAFLLHVFRLNDTTYLSRLYHYYGPIIRQKSYKDSSMKIPNGRFCWYGDDGFLDSTGTVSNGKKDGNWLYVVSDEQMRSVNYENGKVVEEKMVDYNKDGKRVYPDSANFARKDSTLQRAQFKNGTKDWLVYCQKNLHTPERLIKILKSGTHTSIISFLVDKQGYTKDIYLTKSCEWSGDAEALRLIYDSPQWKPAIQNGKPVIYRQKQSLSYRVDLR